MKGGGKLGPKMSNFYVEMDAASMHTMNIPKKFAKIFNGSMKEIVELEGPSELTWHVKMNRSSNNTFVMRSGWKEFVIANRIDKNDVLIFTDKGNSSFNVAIFDRSGCEKAAPFFAKKMEIETETQSEEPNDSSIRENVALHSEVKKEIISFSSGSSDSDEFSSDISSRATRACTIRERVCCKKKRKEYVQESSESDEGEHGTGRIRKTKENRTKKAYPLYIVPSKTCLTKAQEEIANRMARKTQKGSDLFVKILTLSESPARVNCVLWLPVDFAGKVLRSEEKMITLVPANLDKRSKTCTATYFKDKNRKCIGQGWNKFACRNGLKQGDLCLFELRKQERRGILTMVVHFNRVEMETDTPSEESNDSSIRENVALHSEVKKEIISFSSGSSDSDESSCYISSRATRAHTIRERVCCKRKRKEFVQESSESDKGEHGTKKASSLYMIPHKTNLTIAQEETANRMAQKTQKGSDLFVKILTPSESDTPPSRNCVLRLPVGFASKVFESEEKKITLVPASLDRRSKTCTATYLKNKCCKYIGQGWNKFVCRNGLKQGDLCLFELRKQERGEILTMVVHFNPMSS